MTGFEHLDSSTFSRARPRSGRTPMRSAHRRRGVAADEVDVTPPEAAPATEDTPASPNRGNNGNRGGQSGR